MAHTKIVLGAALSALASAGVGAAILFEEPAYKGEAGLCLMFAAFFGALTAALRPLPGAALLGLQVVASTAYMLSALAWVNHRFLFLALEWLPQTLLAFMALQVLLIVWSRAARVSAETAGGASRMVWGAFVVCLVLGGIFVVAMPTFSHDPRFEASVVGDLRTVVMAEAAYASVTGGVYGPLECLATPASCLKGYTGPVFLESRDHRVLESVRYRYRRTFHAGPERTGDNGTRGPASYAYVAVPLKRRSYSARSFCVDDTGILRHDKTGAPPPIKDGRCPETMPPLD